MATITLLGTGASSGVPIIGCSCPVCTSTNSKNRRLRTAALIKHNGENYLIDAGPDIRQQALHYGITRLDGVLVTHTHYDHVAGLEDLRVYNYIQKGKLPCVISEGSLHEIKKLFHYHFKEPSLERNYSTQFEFHILPHKEGRTHLKNLHFHYFTYSQGPTSVVGYRFNDLAYLTDIKNYPEDIFEKLEGVKTLILSALRFTESPLHFTVDEACDFAERAGATHTYFTHVSHDLEYESVETLLRKGVHLGYDGLTINFEME